MRYIQLGQQKWMIGAFDLLNSLFFIRANEISFKWMIQVNVTQFSSSGEVRVFEQMYLELIQLYGKKPLRRIYLLINQVDQ
jgi:hypothetical protein